MRKFRQIGLLKILPEYLLFLGLIFGGFSISGTLAESYFSHAEVAYIELLNQEAEETQDVYVSAADEITPNCTTPAFFDFVYYSQNQAFLIHHFQAREKIHYLENVLINGPVHGHNYLKSVLRLYPTEDFSFAISA